MTRRLTRRNMHPANFLAMAVGFRRQSAPTIYEDDVLALLYEEIPDHLGSALEGLLASSAGEYSCEDIQDLARAAYLDGYLHGRKGTDAALENASTYTWPDLSEPDDVGVYDEIRASVRQLDEEMHPWGEQGKMPSNLPIDGGKVWYWIPGAPEAEQGVLIENMDPEPKRPYKVVGEVYGVIQYDGHTLTDEQMDQAYFCRRWVRDIPRGLPPSGDHLAVSS